MKTIKDRLFVQMISKEEIAKRVKEIAIEIDKDTALKNPLFIGILNGSFLFFADLIRELNVACEVSFMKVASYQKMESGGEVKRLIGMNESITGRDVIIVEDIVDTGFTMKAILEELNSHKPKSIKISTLLHKPSALKTPIQLDYVGFEIENKFVIGYGLDYDGQGRNLDAIYVVKD